MVLTFLAYIFFAGGVVAILYSILALFSLMNHARLQKALPDRDEPGADRLAAREPAVAEAFWERTKILLQNGRFDAALADCKRTLEVNPNHADAQKALGASVSNGVCLNSAGGKDITPPCRSRKGLS